MYEPFSRTDDSLFAQWWWTVDRVLLTAFAMLMLLGLMLVATASPAVAERIGLDSFYFLARHAALVFPCALLALTLSALEPKILWRIATLLLVVSIVGLIAVLFVGNEVKGAQRWISIAGQSLQPSEFVKPALIVVAAWAVSLPPGEEQKWGRWGLLALWIGIIGLLLAQPDLGTSVQISIALATVCVLAGAPLRLAGIGLVAGAGGIIAAYHTLPHVHSRIDRFLDPTGGGDVYQVTKSLHSFSAGGFTGVGPGHGEIKTSLPDAHADFILAVAGEEMGVILVWLILLLFALILWRGYMRLTQERDLFVLLAGGGLLALLGTQVVIHAGSALALIPAKGMTLPFISYGGSAILSATITGGMILSFTRTRNQVGIAPGTLTPTGT